MAAARLPALGVANTDDLRGKGRVLTSLGVAGSFSIKMRTHICIMSPRQ